ncbi:MAG: secretin N-terminal domain-containing protein [Candidatus Omnitrophota bacterium]
MKFRGKIFLAVLFSISLFILSLPLFAQDKTISLDVENMNIEAVLKIIAEQSGFNIVISRNVIGEVTVKLANVTIYQALDTVLKTNNYAYSIEDGVINVYSYQDTQQQERFVNLQTKVFTLAYTNVSDLRRILLSIKTARGRIEINEKNNQVIVTDTPDKVKEIESALKQLDQETEIKKYKLLYSKAADIETKLLQIIPKEKGDIYVDERTNSVIVRATPVILNNLDDFMEGWDTQHKQVLIEAMILEVTLDATTKFGINFESKDTDGKHPSLVDFASKFAVNLASGGPGGVFTLGSLTADEYALTIEVLKSDANTEVLSSPKVTVIDGESANILVGSSEPYSVATTDPVTHLIVQDVRYVDVGVKLDVTPQIGEDEYVTMKIHPEVSTARRVAEVDNVVAKDTTQADSTMMVKNGETVILGGLIKNSKIKTVNKVPILGDIPLIGLLFKNRSTEDVKKEILVFITPHILTNDNRQTVTRQEYKASIDRTGKADNIVETTIEQSGGVEVMPPVKEKRAEAMRKEVMKLLDLRE